MLVEGSGPADVCPADVVVLDNDTTTVVVGFVDTGVGDVDDCAAIVLDDVGLVEAKGTPVVAMGFS